MDSTSSTCLGSVVLTVIALLVAAYIQATPKPCARCGKTARLDVKTKLCPECLALPWYKDDLKTVYVAMYQDINVMQREIESALADGWTIVSTTGLPGHINLGRTATAAMLTGGLSLMVKPSRQKDKITVTFQRAAPAISAGSTVEGE